MTAMRSPGAKVATAKRPRPGRGGGGGAGRGRGGGAPDGRGGRSSRKRRQFLHNLRRPAPGSHLLGREPVLRSEDPHAPHEKTPQVRVVEGVEPSPAHAKAACYDPCRGKAPKLRVNLRDPEPQFLGDRVPRKRAPRAGEVAEYPRPRAAALGLPQPKLPSPFLRSTHPTRAPAAAVQIMGD